MILVCVTDGQSDRQTFRRQLVQEAQCMVGFAEALETYSSRLPRLSQKDNEDVCFILSASVWILCVRLRLTSRLVQGVPKNGYPILFLG